VVVAEIKVGDTAVVLGSTIELVVMVATLVERVELGERTEETVEPITGVEPTPRFKLPMLDDITVVAARYGDSTGVVLSLVETDNVA